MNVMVVNSGSSSIKYQIYVMPEEKLLAKGSVEKIGSKDAIVTHWDFKSNHQQFQADASDHMKGLQIVFGLVGHLEIDAAGHRVAHGGEAFSHAAIVNEQTKQQLDDLKELAPLHNPIHIAGIEASMSRKPKLPHVAVFDTSFHQSLPPHAYLYSVPLEFYQKYKFRKYGFHGSSFRYVSERASHILERPLEKLKLIICHIGNGVSCVALKYGKSMDTSMGMTPLGGLMMGTRSGNIDPALIQLMMNKEQYTIDEVAFVLNKRSGLLGISGHSDMREIMKGMEAGDEQCKLAFDMYEYRIRKEIGAFAAAMDGVDALIFTAGIGERNPVLRKRICDQLSYLGIVLDNESNEETTQRERMISTAKSKAWVLVIPTNEEVIIARETFHLIEAIGEKR